MKMFIKAGILGSLALTAALAAALAIGGIAPERGTQSAAVAPPDLTGAEYVLREHRGVVGIFEPGELLPVSVTDIEVDGLRAGDRELLKAGVAAADREELLELLEDLGS